MRPGTEKVALIVALGAACQLAVRRLDEDGARLAALRDRLWSRLEAGIPGIRLNGHPLDRLPNILNVIFSGVRGCAVLDNASSVVAASTGSACHDGGEAPSAVLTAMGCSPVEALGALRLSVGRPTAEADVEEAVGALVEAWRHANRTSRDRLSR